MTGSRAERRRLAALSRELAKGRPAELTEIPRSEWPADLQEARSRRIAVWVSRQYLVQAFAEKPVRLDVPLRLEPGHDERPIEVLRLSVCRVTRNVHSRWDDGLSWDELQAIKRKIGFARSYAIEIYPPDVDVVNVANMRHLWLLSRPLPIGWNVLNEAPP